MPVGLKIYSAATGVEPFSVNGSMLNPLVLSIDGRLGGASETLLYVANDDPSNSFTNIVVSFAQNPGQDIVNGTNSYSWKLIAGATQPIEQQWAVTDAGSSITLPDISDIVTFSPFWLRIEVPLGAPVDNFNHVSLEIDAVATPV